MVTYLKGDPGGSSSRWENGSEDSPALTGDILQESAQDMIALIRSGVHPISEDHPVRTTNFYVMGAWKQAVFMGISYCHCRVATPQPPPPSPSSSTTSLPSTPTSADFSSFSPTSTPPSTPPSSLSLQPMQGLSDFPPPTSFSPSF
eukprot:90468-Rhodomonas_salina.1